MGIIKIAIQHYSMHKPFKIHVYLLIKDAKTVVRRRTIMHA